MWVLTKQDDGGGSGIIWIICKSFAPRCRQIHASTSSLDFYRSDALPDTQWMNSIKALKAYTYS